MAGYAPLVWKRAKVRGPKESRPTTRGDEDQDPAAPEEARIRPALQPPPPEWNAPGKVCTRPQKGQAQDLQSPRRSIGHTVIVEGA